MKKYFFYILFFKLWQYEFLVQYLTSPMWKIPIYDFLDENCIVFDDEEENKFSYTDIHKVMIIYNNH